MAKRLTEYDEVRGCYRLNTNIYPGGHIQKLGKLEDVADRLRNIDYAHIVTQMDELHDFILELDKEQEEENEQE